MRFSKEEVSALARFLQNDHHMGTVERTNGPKPCECPKTISPKEIREIGEFEIADGFVSSMTARDLEESFNTEGDVNARWNGRMNMGKAARRQMRTQSQRDCSIT